MTDLPEAGQGLVGMVMHSDDAGWLWTMLDTEEPACGIADDYDDARASVENILESRAIEHARSGK